MIQTGLFSLITGFSSVSALIGTRLHPLSLREAETLPAMTYQLVGGSSDPTFETSGMQRLRVQFDCWGENYDDAAGLRDALIKALNGYQGLLSDGTYLQNADLISSIGADYFEDMPRQYRCMVEFYFYFVFPS
jgi:hypothetical protein